MFMIGGDRPTAAGQGIRIEAPDEPLNRAIRDFKREFHRQRTRMVIIEDRMVVDPNVHDAQLLGILLDKKGRVLLPLELEDGRPICIVMDGVERLEAGDFREGNTILSLSVSSGASLDVVDVAAAYGESPTNEGFLPRVMARLVSEGFIAVIVSPSYGCSMACVCRSIDVIPGDVFGLMES
jgi:hypothetical protein